MDLSRVVKLNKDNGFMIYDTEDNCHIGFILGRRSHYNTRGTKHLWSKAQYAKSAFKEHTGTRFDDQTRFIIKEVK